METDVLHCINNEIKELRSATHTHKTAARKVLLYRKPAHVLKTSFETGVCFIFWSLADCTKGNCGAITALT